MADGTAETPRSLAEKLDQLFKVVHPRDRGEFTYREVAAEIQARGGPTISASYIHQLRTGAKDNPTKKHLEALAALFGVSPAYFFDDVEAEKIDAQLALLAALRDAGVRHVTLRAAGLSGETLKAIGGMIERSRQLEGLSRAEPEAAPDGDHPAGGEAP